MFQICIIPDNYPNCHLTIDILFQSLPDSDTMADMYETAIQILEENGFQHYEVSNFARNVRFPRKVEKLSRKYIMIL